MMRVVMHAQFPAMRARAHADSSRAKWALTLVAGSLGGFFGWPPLVALGCRTWMSAFTVSFVDDPLTDARNLPGEAGQ
jgi:hypothetical protein